MDLLIPEYVFDSELSPRAMLLYAVLMWCRAHEINELDFNLLKHHLRIASNFMVKAKLNELKQYGLIEFDSDTIKHGTTFKLKEKCND